MKNRLIILLMLLATSTIAVAGSSPAHNYFSDVVLVNQNGTPMRFYSDVLQGRTVVIESFFSTCPTSCPLMNATFVKIQSAMGEQLGNDVFLVSITVDPDNDTPARLREYAARVGARPGWLFLTGAKENVNRALHKLGLQADSPEQHKNLFLVGNEPKGIWKKVFGLAKADEIIRIVQGVVNEQ